MPQVACLTSTTTAAEVALNAALPMGNTQAESEELLQQTAEACDVELRCEMSASSAALQTAQTDEKWAVGHHALAEH